MNKVININLGGRSYAIEEPGYNALKAYLDNAEKNLEGNPDKEEILKDFNQAIAEKCDMYLNASKNVITSDEIDTILKEMGPVEGASSTDSTKADSTNTSSDAPRHKKLYLISEGAYIFGVCNGLAAYFDVDVTLVRIIFVILAIITHGAWFLVYFLMGMFIPKANTPAEKAEAFGTMRMTAQDFMQRARDGYDRFKTSGEWKKWKRQLKEERKRWKYEQRSYYQRPSPFVEVIHSIIGLIWSVFFIYIVWLSYEHIAVVQQFFNALGAYLGHFIERATEVLRSQTGQ